jgi:hypothetical protein
MDAQPAIAALPKRSIGKMVTTIGVAMFAISIVLAFAGVSGALFHNVMQIGGLVIAVIGVVLWKVMKK